PVHDDLLALRDDRLVARVEHQLGEYVLEQLARTRRAVRHVREVREMGEACAAAALEQPVDAIAELRPRIGQVREQVMRRARPHRHRIERRAHDRREVVELVLEPVEAARPLVDRAQLVDALGEPAPREVQVRLVELAPRAYLARLALVLDRRARAEALDVAELERALDELAALAVLGLALRRGRLAVLDA